MIGMGTLINTAAVAAGGIIGHFTGRLFKAEQQDALTKACGISVLFIAIAGAMEGMLQIQNGGDGNFVNAFVTASLTDLAIAYLSLIGSILIFCVGVNLVWGKTIRVTNLLPSLIFAVAAAYLPISF